MIFAWDEWNRDHVSKHGVRPEDAAYVVEHAAAPFPREADNDKYVVWGQASAGRYLQVVFVYCSESEVDFESLSLKDLMALSNGASVPIVYIIHAMPLTQKMIRQYRRLRRSS